MEYFSELKLTMWVPSDQVGKIVGKQGSTITKLTNETGASLIRALQPQSQTTLWSGIAIHGMPPKVLQAYNKVSEIVGGEVDDCVVMFQYFKAKHGFMSSVSGSKGFEILKKISAESECRIFVPDATPVPAAAAAQPLFVELEGTSSAIFKALVLIAKEGSLHKPPVPTAIISPPSNAVAASGGGQQQQQQQQKNQQKQQQPQKVDEPLLLQKKAGGGGTGPSPPQVSTKAAVGGGGGGGGEQQQKEAAQGQEEAAADLAPMPPPLPQMEKVVHVTIAGLERLMININVSEGAGGSSKAKPKREHLLFKLQKLTGTKISKDQKLRGFRGLGISSEEEVAKVLEAVGGNTALLAESGEELASAETGGEEEEEEGERGASSGRRRRSMSDDGEDQHEDEEEEEGEENEEEEEEGKTNDNKESSAESLKERGSKADVSDIIEDLITATENVTIGASSSSSSSSSSKLIEDISVAVHIWANSQQALDVAADCVLRIAAGEDHMAVLQSVPHLPKPKGGYGFPPARFSSGRGGVAGGRGGGEGGGAMGGRGGGRGIKRINNKGGSAAAGPPAPAPVASAQQGGGGASAASATAAPASTTGEAKKKRLNNNKKAAARGPPTAPPPPPAPSA